MFLRNIRIALFAITATLLTTIGANAQAVYNSIATAYVTTTISQQVVFDNTMKQGGTYTLSVLAHNGGGRANQSDTANVKIQFYTSNGTLVTSVNSSYSSNLPNPNAVCGNPCIDPNVPWTTLTTSTTLTSAQAANVAYATVSMYGVDGSYWAGDYGPWYRAPTFTLNGSGNLLYNPEFGPYNGITAQGWVSSPGFGACQGAWGGSNACIVNSSGTPGTSTVGLVANQNGGGPSATGGTVNGTPGGYNSSMNVNNPNGAPAATTSTNPSGTTITASLGQSTDSSITNAGTINTSGTDKGISATDSSTTTITNSGTITTNNGGGIVASQGTSTSGNITITNSGSITSNTSGSITNMSGAQGISVQFTGTGSTGTATVTNTSTGTISVTNDDGVVINGYGTQILNNNGSITSTPTGTNSMPAVMMNKSATINNNGSITGDVGTDFASATSPTINNNAGGTITGNSGLAIINIGTTTGTTINNAGTITGDVQLPTNGTYNFLGTGSQVGAIRFNGNAGGDVYVGTNSTTATAILQGNIGDPTATSAPAGTYGNFPMPYTFGNLNSITIGSGSSLTDSTGYNLYATTVTNNGTFTLDHTSTTNITGAFVNNGAFSTTFNGPAYSILNVNGAVTVGSNATYTPIVTGNNTSIITLNSPYSGVITSTGGITGDFTTGNGSVGNLNWAISKNGNNYDVLWTSQGPTIVSTGTGTPIITTSSSDGTPVSTDVTNTYNVSGVDSNGNPTLTTYYTITTTTTTPQTVTTTSTPVTVTTWSDGTTTQTNGTPVVTVTNNNVVTTSTTQPAVQLVATTTPDSPTVTSSSVNGTTTTTTSVAYGTPTQTATIVSGTPTAVVTTGFNSVNGGNKVAITRTDTTTVSTPYTTTITTDTPVYTTTTNTTPVTTTTVTTPNYVTSYSDGSSSTTSSGASTTTVTTADAVTSSVATTTQTTSSSSNGVQVVATPVSATATANTKGLQDSIDHQNSNLFLVDPFFAPDGSYVNPIGSASTTSNGSINTGGLMFGHQGIGKNGIIWGVAGYYGQANSNSYDNSQSTSTTGAATAYTLYDTSNGKVKTAVGYAYTDHTNTISMPTIGIGNQQKVGQQNVYADLAYYSPTSYKGWTPFGGVIVNTSNIADKGSSGSALLSQTPSTGITTTATPYVGVQSNVSKDTAVQFKVSQSPIYGTVGSASIVAKKNIAKNTNLYLSGGVDVGSNYVNGTVMAGIVVNF